MLPTLQQLSVKKKKVLVRVDFNVPIREGKIVDTSRIEAALPTISYLLEQGASLILLSHLGRPKAKPNLADSLSPCAAALCHLLGRPVQMAPDCVGKQVEELVGKMGQGEVILLENLRFHPGEENPSLEPDFTKGLAQLGDCYVNDAFGAAHRAHASITELPQFFPGCVAAGFLLEKEIRYLDQIGKHPERPFCVLLGGAKISTKLPVVQTLLQKADKVLIGGGMAFTFLQAAGYSIGRSLCEKEFTEKAKQCLQKAGQKLMLPVDLIVADALSQDAVVREVSIQEGVPEQFYGVDIGPKTVAAYRKEILGAKTVFWNGPLGIFEIPSFAQGTYAIARVFAEAKGTTIIGGGDSLSAFRQAGPQAHCSHLSTGGGASLEYIEHGTLPGIEALELNGRRMI